MFTNGVFSENCTLLLQKFFFSAVLKKITALNNQYSKEVFLWGEYSGHVNIVATNLGFSLLCISVN